MFFCDQFFCSSFNDKTINDSLSGPLGNELFQKEQDDLLSDLKDIPKKACDRKVSFYLYILSYIIYLSKLNTNTYTLICIILH